MSGNSYANTHTKIIAVIGIHGVGKNHILSQISNDIYFKWYDASSLIKIEIGESDKAKKVIDINSNQKILIDSIGKNIIDSIAILNGHFCIINNKNEIHRIPKEILKKLNIIKVILIVDDIDKISNRIKLRDNVDWDKQFLNRLQKAEKEYSTEVTREFNIPQFIHKNGDDLEGIVKFINESEMEYNGE